MPLPPFDFQEDKMAREVSPTLDQSKALLIRDRLLVSKQVKLGEQYDHKLESVRDYIRRVNRAQNMQVIKVPLNQTRVSFLGGVMRLRIPGQGIEARVSAVAADQLASYILPPRFFSGLKVLARMGEKGATYAEQSWNHFAEATPSVRILRFIHTKIGGEAPVMMLRSCQSLDYAFYSNLEMVESLCNPASPLANLPVLGWALSDSGLRVRFACMSDFQVVFNQLGAENIQAQPVPLIEAWNSEVGQRKVGLRSALWQPKSGLSMGSSHVHGRKEWVHRGNVHRIRGGVKSEYPSLVEQAGFVAERYAEAQEIEVDDVEAWVIQELMRRKETETAKTAVTDYLKANPGPPTLARAVDAVSSLALGDCDLFEQAEKEELADEILVQGIAVAKKSNNQIKVKS